MDKRKTELQIVNITVCQERSETYTMILKELDGERKLSINIGASEAQSMILELRGIIPPRPMTHHLFASVLEALGVKLLRVLIYRVVNGIFYTYIYLQANTSILRVDARTSDAVTLALRMRAPIYVYESILEEATAHIENLAEQGEEQLQWESLDVLQTALQKAVENENYEFAAKLRDIIKQRIQP